MSINRGVDKEGVVHIHNRILLSYEKERNNGLHGNMDGTRNYHAESETSVICYHIYVESKKKKGYNELLCRIGTDSQTLKNLLFPKETSCGAGGGGNGLRVWEGNAIKLGCDDHCATINVIKFTELKIKRRYNNPVVFIKTHI